MKRQVAGLQQLGRAMMLPIAVLPIAGLLLRVGQPDLLGWAAMAAAGDAIFSNLGLLFAVGVGVGLARENHGAGGLAALVGYLVTTHALESLSGAPPGALAKLSIPIGLLSGVIAGYSYNHFGEITLPNYLSFFSGRRFVPIVSGLAGLALAAVLGYAWPPIEHGMDTMSHAILSAGPIGMFAYGLLNRLLIITGLHHILNNVAWFIIGDYHGATGDLRRFFAGDPTAGAFMSGFFPVMMFGLPGACLAMYHTARPERRARVGGLLLSLALTSFLTGVTEPIEFTFMFLAPVLYALHAVATGLAMVIMNFFGVRLGFSFSAGLFDYVLNYSHAQKPLLLLPIGAGYFLLYYVVFRVTIVYLNLATPGREPPGTVTEQSLAAPHGPRAPAFVTALGGAQNLTEVEACTTRLRLVLADNKAVDEATLRVLGAQGVIRTGTNGLQVVLGPIADQVAGEIRAALRAAPAATPASVPAAAAAAATAPVTVAVAVPAAAAAVPPPSVDAPGLLAALGGRDNVVDLAISSGRLLIRAARPESIDESALGKLGLRGIARSAADKIQVLVAGPVENWSEPLRRLL